LVAFPGGSVNGAVAAGEAAQAAKRKERRKRKDKRRFMVYDAAITVSDFL
jgi:hypothetical protein